MKYLKSIDQPLLRDGVKTIRASAVITEPYVMADKTRSATYQMTNGAVTHYFDRVTPSHWMDTSRSFALLVGSSLASIGPRGGLEDGFLPSDDEA